MYNEIKFYFKLYLTCNNLANPRIYNLSISFHRKIENFYTIL